MYKNIVIFLVAMAWATIKPASAQQLIVQVPDTAWQHNTTLITNDGYQQLTFNKKGVAHYTDNNLSVRTVLYLNLNNSINCSAVVEPGKTLKIKFSGKKGKRPQPVFSGPNANYSQLLTLFGQFYPAKDRGYELMNHPTDTISYQEAFEKLNQQHKQLVDLANKLPLPSDRTKNLLAIERRYLACQLRLTRDQLESQGKEPNREPQYQQLISNIQPNDTSFLDEGLLNTFIMAKMPMKVTKETPVDQFGIAYTNTICQWVANQDIKDILLENVASSLLNTDDDAAVERFWNHFTTKASPQIVKKYQFIIDSKHTTQSGMQCPDVTFSDANGQQNRLSNFFGKVLYIDLWATWCMPCLAQIPALEEHVAHYANNNAVQFISISLDSNHNAWLKKVQEDAPKWPQFIVNNEENKLISEQWGVMSIPRFLIINADGTINNADAFRPTDKQFREKLDAIIAAQK